MKTNKIELNYDGNKQELKWAVTKPTITKD